MASTVAMYKRIESGGCMHAPVPTEHVVAHAAQGWFVAYDTIDDAFDAAEGTDLVATLNEDIGKWVLTADLGLRIVPPTDALGNTVEMNDLGAMQAVVEGRFDLIDYHADRVLAEVFAYGAKKYAEENWRGIPVRSHLNHALRHIRMALHEIRTGVNPEPGEDHLGHALCRVHMAVAIREQGGESKEAMSA